MRKQIIGVIGGHDCDTKVEELASILGKKLAEVGDILVCGGLGGVMKAACKGFKSGGGQTMGILPTYNKDDANEFVDIVVPSGLGFARNVLVVKTSDVIVALPGEEGTLSEIAFALQFGIPVISLNSWGIPGVVKTETVEAAVEEVKKRIISK